MVQDPVQVAPDVYRMLFENDRFRLLEVSLEPGASSAMHSHPDYLVYGLGDGTVKFTSPSGEAGEVEIKAGDTMWREAEEHAAENVGTTDIRVLLFELK